MRVSFLKLPCRPCWRSDRRFRVPRHWISSLFLVCVLCVNVSCREVSVQSKGVVPAGDTGAVPAGDTEWTVVDPAARISNYTLSINTDAPSDNRSVLLVNGGITVQLPALSTRNQGFQLILKKADSSL